MLSYHPFLKFLNCFKISQRTNYILTYTSLIPPHLSIYTRLDLASTDYIILAYQLLSICHHRSTTNRSWLKTNLSFRHETDRRCNQFLHSLRQFHSNHSFLLHHSLYARAGSAFWVCSGYAVTPVFHCRLKAFLSLKIFSPLGNTPEHTILIGFIVDCVMSRRLDIFVRRLLQNCLM